MIRTKPRSLNSISSADWAEAVRREGVIRPLAEGTKIGRAAVLVAAKQLNLSTVRVYELIQDFRESPVAASLARKKSGSARGHRRLDGGVEAVIESVIDKLVLKGEPTTMRRLLYHIRRDCSAVGLKPPSATAVQARVSARSLRERMKARHGLDAVNNRLRQVKTGLRATRPLQIVQIDHTKVDIILVDDVTRACIGRPWLTVVLDVCTRMVLGFVLGLDAPSASIVGLAVTHAVLPKTKQLERMDVGLTWPAQGLPEIIHVDNAREFHSRAFERGCQQHGIKLEYRPRGRPNFGGHIERLMGTLMGRIHALPGTTFSNVASRGDYQSEKRAVLSFHEFERIFLFEILGPYQNEVHSALGSSPLAHWDANVSQSSLRLPADPNAFLLDFLPFEERVVRRDGVRLFNIQYQDGGLAHVVEGGGAKLRVKYDPRDLSAVFVELETGDHVRVPYADVGRPPITLWEHSLATKNLRTMGRANEHAIFTAIEEQRRVLSEAQKRSKQARRLTVRKRLAAEQTEGALNETPRQDAFQSDDSENEVPMPGDGTVSGVEFWE